MDQIEDVIEDVQDEVGVADAARLSSNAEASTSDSQVSVLP